MKIFLYNTLGRKKEEFKPLLAGRLSFYYCGPTVYFTPHLGNLRGALCADIVHRTFKYLNYDVLMARNYTDVGHLTSDADEGEDKMTKTVRAENLRAEEVAAKYIAAYEEDTGKLNILEPKFKPRATETIAEMIEMIQLLMAKGYAYGTDLGIYFSVGQFENYNRLSGRHLDQDQAGAGRGEVSDPKKKDPRDFSLWFFKAGNHKSAAQFWPSPFVSPLTENGYGFPGWHLECSAMIKKFLGDTIDIHMGGIEHISIHHSNEIAQSEASSGLKLANYWLHNEHLLVDKGKMSKSLGNVFNLKELEAKGFSPMALRFFFLQAHYRSRQNFTFEALKAAQKGLSSLIGKMEKLGRTVGQVDSGFRDKFLERLLDDFNAPKSLSLIAEILKSDLSPADQLATLLDFDQVWALNLAQSLSAVQAKEWPQAVNDLLKQREEARKNKDFARADEIRDELARLGYEVRDLPGGQSLAER